MVYMSSAQVQRRPVKQQPDSATVSPVAEKNKDNRKEIFRELNLTREQKGKMKEINQSMKASKDAIENDTTLSEAEKKAKLKTLRNEHTRQVQAVLTEEQKVRFRQLKDRQDPE